MKVFVREGDALISNFGYFWNFFCLFVDKKYGNLRGNF